MKYKGYSKYYRSRLQPQEQEVYISIVKGLENFEPTIRTKPVSEDSLTKIMKSIQYDNPHLFFVDFSYRYIVSTLFCEVQITYLMTREERASFDQQIQKAILPLLRQLSGKTMSEGTLMIHDWLSQNITYDTINYYPNSAHSVVGAFCCFKCVCEGYAKAFKYLCDMIRLPCIIVIGDATNQDGTTEAHAWNMVHLDDGNYHVDVTFDVLFANKYCSRAYYLLSDQEIRYDHKPWTIFDLPACPKSGDILRKVGGTRELMDFLALECLSGKTHSEVRLTCGFTRSELMNMIQNRIQAKDVYWYNRIQSYWYGDYCRTLFILWK